MYATAHLDLVRTAVAEHLEGARSVEPARIPATPARITTWGPRPSSRLAPVATPRVVDCPVPGSSHGRPHWSCWMRDARHWHDGGHGAFRPC